MYYPKKSWIGVLGKAFSRSVALLSGRLEKDFVNSPMVEPHRFLRSHVHPRHSHVNDRFEDFKDPKSEQNPNQHVPPEDRKLEFGMRLAYVSLNP